MKLNGENERQTKRVRRVVCHTALPGNRVEVARFIPMLTAILTKITLE